MFHGKNPADERNDARYITKMGNEDEEDAPHSSRKKNRLRGRKGKYYEQVDDEDQSFLQDQDRLQKSEAPEDDLGCIEEESQNTNDDDRLLMSTQKREVEPLHLEEEHLASALKPKTPTPEKEDQQPNADEAEGFMDEEKVQEEIYQSVDAQGEQTEPPQAQEPGGDEC